jgi:DNA modification methylase
MSIIIPKKLLGDCRQTMQTLPAKSFHTSVSSPPYFGMREYLPKDHPLKPFEIGNEDTLELYLQHIVEVYTEMHRIIRDDGIIWVNIGDRYTSGGRRIYDRNAKSMTGQVQNHAAAGVMRPKDPPGLKKKELCLMPVRVAMALQQAGWYLRSQIPWVKRNCMPESAADRPATAIEYFFMFTKSERYFYDADAVKIKASENTHPRAAVFPHRSLRDMNRRRLTPKAAQTELGSKQHGQWRDAHSGVMEMRNRRNSDWFMESFQGLLLDDDDDPMALVVNPKGTTIKHFAAYPPKLVEPLILCSTSEAGCCPECGGPFTRILREDEPDREHQKACGGDSLGGYNGQATKDFDAHGVQNASDVKRRILEGMKKKTTIGFQPSCDCYDVDPVQTPVTKMTPKIELQLSIYRKLERVPCRVIDPFHGTGTTSEVSVGLGRDYTGCEISDVYFKDSDIKDSQTAMSLI